MSSWHIYLVQGILYIRYVSHGFRVGGISFWIVSEYGIATFIQLVY